MKSLLSLFFALLTCGILVSQEPKELFTTDEVLEIKLTFDEKEVYNDLEDREYHEAVLEWTDESGSPAEIPVRLKTRGKTRAMKATCRIPPMFMNFKEAETKGTPFHKQKKIKLVTHCKDSKSFKEYVKKEYLAYRLYNLISDYGLQVRLCRITYVDSKKPEDQSTHYGFLLEDIDDLAKRKNMKEYDGLIRNQEVLDKDNLDKLTLFQYMIGNLDWSVPERHNIKIMLADDGSLPVAVPYDFDYSGLVDAPYAVPPEGMGLPGVTTRLFWGLCREGGYESQIQFYRSMQSRLLEEVNKADYMDEKSRSEAKSYLNGFFVDINNPNTVRKNIDQACRAKHKHLYEY